MQQKIDKNNYSKKITVCKKSYNRNRRNTNIIKTLIQSQQSKSDKNHNDKKKRKVVDSVNKNKTENFLSDFQIVVKLI